MIVMLAYFIFLLICLFILRNKSIALIFLVIQIISLSGHFLIGLDLPIDSVVKALNLLVTMVLLTIIILPWLKIQNISDIGCPDERKLIRLTKVLLAASFVVFVMFSITATFVILLVDDIGEFKYGDGVSTEFYYSLPINIKLLIVSNFLYNISYFLIPLHFYFLIRKKYWLSFFCFLFSLNIVLYGLTFFSRAVFIHYSFIYFSFVFILYNAFSKSLKIAIKTGMMVAFVSVASYFVYITNGRFTEDVNYENEIPIQSIIQTPTTYSYFDYLSQWYYNGMYVLNDYKFKTFSGQTAFQPILGLLNDLQIYGYSTAGYVELRQELWPLHWFKFNGFVAYTIYDFGYIMGFILCIIYACVVYFNKPVNNVISIFKLFNIVLLVQIPLLAIFYSALGAIIIPFIFLLPAYFYLKVKV